MTNPESVYSQQPSAASHGWLEGTAWAARLSPRLDDPLLGLDTPGGLHSVPPLDSPSKQRAPVLWLELGKETPGRGDTLDKPEPGRTARRVSGVRRVWQRVRESQPE